MQLEEVYKLLNENYVEDEDNMFRFDYSEGFLQWYVTKLNFDWLCVMIKKVVFLLPLSSNWYWNLFLRQPTF